MKKIAIDVYEVAIIMEVREPENLEDKQDVIRHAMVNFREDKTNNLHSNDFTIIGQKKLSCEKCDKLLLFDEDADTGEIDDDYEVDVLCNECKNKNKKSK